MARRVVSNKSQMGANTTMMAPNVFLFILTIRLELVAKIKPSPLGGLCGIMNYVKASS